MSPTVDAKPPRAAEDLGPRTRAHTRYHTADGGQVPGVTTVVDLLAKPALARWANQLGLEGIDMGRYVDETAQIGTLTHYRISCQLRGQSPELGGYTPDQLEHSEASMRSWERWRADKHVEPVLVEQPLVSERWRFGGTVDFLGRVEGELELIDFKTSRAVYEQHRIQVAAYVVLANEHGHRLDHARVLRIGRADEGLEEHRLGRTELVRGWKVFLRLLEVWRLLKEPGR